MEITWPDVTLLGWKMLVHSFSTVANVVAQTSGGALEWFPECRSGFLDEFWLFEDGLVAYERFFTVASADPKWFSGAVPGVSNGQNGLSQSQTVSNHEKIL